MLIPARSSRVALAVALAVVAAGALSAPAQGRDNCWVSTPSAGLVYVCDRQGSGDSGSPGTGSGARPSCDLTGPPTFCIGTDACWYTEWGVPWAIPPEPKPGPDAVEKVQHCLHAEGGESIWPVWVGGDGEPPLAVQAEQAIGEIRLPGGELAVNPSTRSLVGLPTWFWVAGLPDGELRGSSAFGLVAVATPSHLEVDPGDGTGTLRCPWTTSAAAAEDDCAHTYQRSSIDGTRRVDGQPAFAAAVTAVWTVEFEDGGVPVAVPGAPGEVRSPAWTIAVPVAEVQALVTLR